jgi:alkylhydroperoxidase/carboxymuconolactone decarboxylase family protein YurZ
VADAPAPPPSDAATALLARIEAGRGYVLPHHRLLATHAPRALVAYDALYRALTLDAGALSPADRERAWLALLAVDRKFSWRIHLARARDAGLTDADVAECLALATLAAGRDVAAYGAREWRPAVAAGALDDALRTLFDAARGRTSPGTAHLVLAVCHATRGDQGGVRAHLPAALGAGVSAAGVAEALAFVLLQRGVNALIECVQTWNEAAAAGECVPPYPPAPALAAGREDPR